MLTLSLTIWAQDVAAQEVWPKTTGAYHLAVGERWMVADQHFDRDGVRQDNIARYGYYATYLQAEYGLSDALSIQLDYPFIAYTYSLLPLSGQKRSQWSTGDMDIGFQYLLAREEKMALGISVVFGLPLGESDSAMPSGDGEFNQAFRIDVMRQGTPFGTKAWWSTHVGYNVRSKGFSDEIWYGLKGGIHLDPDKFIFIAAIEGRAAYGAENNAPHIRPESLFSNHRSWLHLSPELLFQVKPTIGLHLRLQAPLAGENYLGEPMYQAGLIFSPQLIFSLN